MSKLSAEQKKKMAVGREAAKQRKEEELVATATKEKQDTIDAQATELDELRKQVSAKNVDMTHKITSGEEIPKEESSDLAAMRKELDDLKLVLIETGGIPKKVSTTRPWSSIGRPFHKDIYKVKKQHKGFEIGFISEENLDEYVSDGYNVVDGKDYGEKDGTLKRKRMIAVEQPVAAAEEKRSIQRAFNKLQRTSELQKVEELSKNIRRSGGGAKVEFTEQENQR